MRQKTVTSTLAWLLSLLMAITPTTQVLADSFSDAASQGQTIGRDLVPDPNALFQSDEDGGGYEIFPDSDKPISVSPEDLFGTGPGSSEELKGLKGDDEAIRNKTIARQAFLAEDQSEYGEAYRVLTSSSERAHPDMSEDPIWDTSRDVMEDLFEGEYSACEVTRNIVEDGFTTHVPDYQICNRVRSIKESCTINHDYEAEVIEHASGPLNIQTCGNGCRKVPLSRGLPAEIICVLTALTYRMAALWLAIPGYVNPILLSLHATQSIGQSFSNGTSASDLQQLGHA